MSLRVRGEAAEQERMLRKLRAAGPSSIGLVGDQETRLPVEPAGVDPGEPPRVRLGEARGGVEDVDEGIRALPLAEGTRDADSFDRILARA